MRKLLFILFLLPILTIGQNTYVPDDNFENYLETNGMGDGIPLNDSVYTSAIDTLITLDVSNMNISDLTGIEDFTALWSLNCANNQLTNLDVSNSTGLNLLHCGFNQLTGLDVTNNIFLTSLVCWENQITDLDITNNINLIDLYCRGNQLTSLDVSNNSNLGILACSQNPITHLDLSQNPDLWDLYCYMTLISTLDVSNNPILWSLSCFSSQLTTLDVSNNPALVELWCDNNQLTSLDVSNCPALMDFSCSNNTLTNLDLRNGNNTVLSSWGFVCTGNPTLSCIAVDDPAWATTNWTVGNGNVDPQHYFSSNCLTGLKSYIPDDNFENYLEANGMGDGIPLNDSVYTSAIDTVTILDVSSQWITDLTGIENFSSLQYLDLSNNNLTTFNISTNILLDSLKCNYNMLTSLDLSNNTALKYLSCGGNQLTSLDVSNNIALTFLAYGHNLFTNLDVSNNVNLNILDCGNNQLTSLDLSNNTALEYLDCGDNQLTSLDLSNNIALTYLYCYNNQLTSLDVRNGNNNFQIVFIAVNNPNLNCILVDDPVYSVTNWVGTNFSFDLGTSFSMFCTPQTNTPDNNFESYLEANGMGNGVLGDDSVSTINISSVANLNVGGLNISDLTGIEDFSSLQYLDCSNNNLTDLDISNNIQLTNLQCEANILSTLNFDVSLTSLDCFNNQLTTLDLSNNPNLTFLNCSYNSLTWLDLRNGNNQSLISPNFTGNPTLSCILVDNPQAADDDWPWDDDWSSYSTTCDLINSWNCVGNDCLGDSTGLGMYTVLGDCQITCGASSLLENESNSAKELIKVIDVLGRYAEQTNERILFYLFDDGTVEKRIVLE